VSDPPAPGWWQASDGRWYPPELHPDPATRAGTAARGEPVPTFVPQPVPLEALGPVVVPGAAPAPVAVPVAPVVPVTPVAVPVAPVAPVAVGTALVPTRAGWPGPGASAGDMFPPPLLAPALPPHQGDARHRRRWPVALVLVLMAGAAAGLYLSRGGGAPSRGSGTTTTVPPETTSSAPDTTTTGPAATTTAPEAIPSSPQASAEVAARALVGAWAVGNRPAASSVATTSAVDTLFATPYPGGNLASDRGCGASASPVTCTFGPPGGANPNDAIYSVLVTQTSAGTWYVSSVRVEG